MRQGKSPPGWVSVLIAAEEWGTPPWKVLRGDKLTWWVRWLVWRSERARASGK
jgi:hypothetical protein